VIDEQEISSADWLSVPEVAERLHLRIPQVHRLIGDGQLLAVRRDGVLRVPTELVTTDDRVAKHITGILTVLRDDGYTNDEMLRWLFTPDDSLEGKPIDALHGHKAREAKRRAQALAL